MFKHSVMAIGAASFGLALSGLSARAETYSTRAGYNAATANNATLNFENPISQGGIFYGDTYASNGITFTGSGARFFIINASVYGTNTTQYLNNNAGAANFNVLFQVPAYGFALDIGARGYSALPIITVNGEVFNFSVPRLDNTGSLPSFFAYSSSTAFSSVSFQASDLIIDNFSFTSTAPVVGAVAVPGPVAGAGIPALLAIGGVVWARRRKALAA